MIKTVSEPYKDFSEPAESGQNLTEIQELTLLLREIFKEEQSRSNYNILTAIEREYLGQLDLKEKEKDKGIDKKRLRYLNTKIAEFEEAIKRREDSIRKRHAEEVLS